MRREKECKIHKQSGGSKTKIHENPFRQNPVPIWRTHKGSLLNLANSDLPLAHGLGPSETMVLNPPLSTVNHMHEGFSVSEAPFLGFGLADPTGRGRPLFADKWQVFSGKWDISTTTTTTQSARQDNRQRKNSAVHMDMLEKARKTISTTAMLWRVKAIFEKRAATEEVDGKPSFIQCVCWEELCSPHAGAKPPTQHWIEILHPSMGPRILSSIGAFAGGRLLRNFQAPTLYRSNKNSTRLKEILEAINSA